MLHASKKGNLNYSAPHYPELYSTQSFDHYSVIPTGLPPASWDFQPSYACYVHLQYVSEFVYIDPEKHHWGVKQLRLHNIYIIFYFIIIL